MPSVLQRYCRMLASSCECLTVGEPRSICAWQRSSCNIVKLRLLFWSNPCAGWHCAVSQLDSRLRL